MNEEVKESQLSVEVLEAKEQEVVGQEEIEFGGGVQEEVVLYQEEQQELQQQKEEHQEGRMQLEEQEEVQQLKELQQTEEEELQKEEVQTEKMSWAKEQQIDVQQQTEQEQQIEKEQHQTEKGQIEELQDFDDTLEQTHNNQVLIRLRGMLKEVLEQMDCGAVDLQELRRNLELAAALLDAVYTDETRRLLDTEDELSDLQAESVPSEVRDWLACTFSRKMGVTKRRPEEKPRFRSIVHAVQAGIFVERMYRRTSNMAGLTYPPTALTALKEVDQWSFDVFSFHEATGDHALKFLVYDLLTRYDLINRFRIPVQALVQFVEALENGYSKHKNPYHNLIHAADVTQTAHFMMLHTGLMHWLSELEILAMVFAAAIHDFEHTGTTNNFHIHTRSEVAILYNDRSVLENHHVSAAYRLMAEDDMNILGAEGSGHRDGDVNRHVMSLSADQNYEECPDTDTQGDKEVELGLPFSPLCDRKATMIAQSQIGFIDFIVEPTFSGLIDTTEKVIGPLIEEERRARETGNRRSSVSTLATNMLATLLSLSFWTDRFKLTCVTSATVKTAPPLCAPSSRLKVAKQPGPAAELANKAQEEQEEVASNVNSVSDRHTYNQSQRSNGSSPDQTHNDKFSSHTSADHLTWNGMGPGVEKEEDDDEVPENA
ncbi:Calcium/calmodulin-dependent 3' [Nibea albiflora]|uniref:Calcium/calmodulin-dependent 3 n=1 Tax=Nibea albiflora TaxID=240163 RepID=A0ACB7EGL5_NIBAL|nr:Calcium/calmodulin-dependent 3' [Nibea albiflora]